MKVKDLMVPVYDYLRPNSSLKEAVNLLRIAIRGEQKFGVMGAYPLKNLCSTACRL
jgi:hypothetical protein